MNATGPKKPRNAPDLSLDAQVAAAIYDNVRFFTKEQLDGHKVEDRNPSSQFLWKGWTSWNNWSGLPGKSGREWITEGKQHCRREGASTGKNWWKWFKAAFSLECVHGDALKLGEAAVYPEPLWGFFKAAIYEGKRGPLASWCTSATALSLVETKILAKTMTMIAPTKTRDMYHLGMEILELFARQSVHVHHASVWGAVRPRADAWMCEADR
eukprot:1410121-Amphidinium_carterae.1